MQTPHPTYKIREGDTIQSITERFNVAESKWIKYHNEKCPLSWMIVQFIPWYAEEIYLLPELWHKAEQLNQAWALKPNSIVLDRQNRVCYAPENLSNRYGVVLLFPKNKIHYEIDFHCTERISDDIYRILIHRGQVYINGQQPDTMLYEIADLTNKAVYPLDLDINRHQRIAAIANYSEIVRRCGEAQQKIEESYAGEHAEKYIRLFRQHYGNANNLRDRIKNELFYRLFFLPVHGFYDADFQQKILYGFSEEHDAQEYHLTIRLEPEYGKSGKITARVVSEEMQNGQPCFEADYRLHPEDHSIFSVQGNLTKNNGRTVEFKIEHLNPEKRILNTIIPDYKKFYMKEEKNASKKTGFWNIFR